MTQVAAEVRGSVAIPEAEHRIEPTSKSRRRSKRLQIIGLPDAQHSPNIEEAIDAPLGRRCCCIWPCYNNPVSQMLVDFTRPCQDWLRNILEAVPKKLRSHDGAEFLNNC